MVVALFWKFSALRFSLASATSFAFASADNSCWAAAGSGARKTEIAANAIAMCVVVFITTSTVLWTRRDDAAARQCDGADEAGTRLVPRAAQFHAQGLP